MKSCKEAIVLKKKNAGECIWFKPPFGKIRPGRCLFKSDHGRKINGCPVKCKNYIPKRPSVRATIEKYGPPRITDNLVAGVTSRLFQSIVNYEAMVAWENLGASCKKDSIRKSQYPFIPRETHHLIELLYAAHRLWYKLHPHQTPKFLDCGAGVGNVMVLADVIGFHAYGIEYDKNTIRRGKQFLRMFGWQRPGKALFQGNLLTFDKFHEYDVLYYYCPMRRAKEEKEFECRLTEGMAPGAMLIGGAPYTRNREPLFQCVDVHLSNRGWPHGSVYIKGR